MGEAKREIEIAGVVINDLITLLGVDGNAALAEAARQYAEEHADDPPGKFGLKIIDLSEEGFAKVQQTPSWRWHNAVMRAKAAIAYAFIRSICNEHSDKDAARLLFSQQPGPGSGWLVDYIGDLIPRTEKAK